MAHFLGIGLLALAGCAGAGETVVPTSTTAPTAAPVPTSTPVVAASTPSPTVAPTETASSDGIGPEDIIAILPMDAIPAILDPQFLSAASAEDQMDKRRAGHRRIHQRRQPRLLYQHAQQPRDSERHGRRRGYCRHVVTPLLLGHSLCPPVR